MPGPGTVTLIAKLGQQADADFKLVDASDIDFATAATVTIAADTITQPAGSWQIPLDTEAAAASDDLATITKTAKGPDFIIVAPVSDARTIIVKHNTGNILCVGNADITLDDAHDICFLVYNTTTTKWMACLATPSAGVTDHGALTGLADDDHPQYETSAEAAAKVTAHEAAGDPHTGYRLESADHTHATTGLQAGTVDHGALTGLADDDHPQYTTTAEAQALVDVHTGDGSAAHAASAVSFVAGGSIAATDVQAAVAEVATDYISADATHAALATHHTRLHTVTDTLDHTFPGGTSTFLRADGTYATPPGGGSGDIAPALAFAWGGF